MGIHNFHKWLKNNYNKCYISTDVPFEADYVYIDVNFALHNCIGGTKSFSTLIKKLMTFIENVLNNVIPKKKLILATDGPAPFAKLLLQRKRRLQMSRKIEDDVVITDKTVSPLVFTPGTNFMDNFSVDLDGFFKILEGRFGIKVCTLFTGSDEAELKIMNALVKNNVNKNESHVFLSNDADVVVMASAVEKYENIYIGIKNNKAVELFKIGEFVKQLRINTGNLAKYPNLDFALLSLMMGNDYLPKILCATFERLWDCYRQTLRKFKCGMVDGKINIAFLKEFMFRISSTLNAAWINKIQLSTYNTNDYKQYLHGLTWCFDIYRTSVCRKYDYMYDSTPPHPMGIYYYLKYIDDNIYMDIDTKSDTPLIKPELYAILLLPLRAKNLVNKKYHKLMETKLAFLYEEEKCKTCIELHSEISNIAKTLTYMKSMGEDTDAAARKMGGISSKLGKHRKIHKDITMKDITLISKMF